jgi:hypothetical protein
MLPPQKIRSAFNNQYADAIAQGDPRLQMKTMDRGGQSRGAGQQSHAGIMGAQKMAAGIADAYSQRQSAQDYNNAFTVQDAQADASQQQSIGALLQQQQYNTQMSALQRQNSALNFATSILGGLLD